MRRYARFSEDYINESMENYDNLEAAAEEMLEAYYDFCEAQHNIAETYNLDSDDLQEVSDIINQDYFTEAYFVRRAKKNQPEKKYVRKGVEVTRKPYTYIKAPLIVFTGDENDTEGKKWKFYGPFDRTNADYSRAAQMDGDPHKNAAQLRSQRSINAGKTRAARRRADDIDALGD